MLGDGYDHPQPKLSGCWYYKHAGAAFRSFWTQHHATTCVLDRFEPAEAGQPALRRISVAGELRASIEVGMPRQPNSP